MKESRPTCPLCEQGFDRQGDLRVHLMVNHRKSAVADELLRAVGREELHGRA